MLTPPVASPRLTCDVSGTTCTWIITDEWADWACAKQVQLIDEMVSHTNWFSKPPRRDVLEPLFGPWAGRDMKGRLHIYCAQPSVLEEGSAVWTLDALMMTSSSITPVWTVTEFVPAQDKISLFGDEEGEGEEGTREIELGDIEMAATTGTPTRIRSREWEARKFLAKERVRESRLKVQIADRLASKEESRFYAMYGDLEDNESHFSDYDLTDEEESMAD